MEAARKDEAMRQQAQGLGVRVGAAGFGPCQKGSRILEQPSAAPSFVANVASAGMDGDRPRKTSSAAADARHVLRGGKRLHELKHVGVYENKGSLV